MSERSATEPRSGRTIALIGVDGSGKTTIARRLATSISATYVYMGTNPGSASHELPTTRWIRTLQQRLGRPARYEGGPPRRPAAGQSPKPPSVVRRLRSAAYVTRLMTEELYRQALIRRATRRGETVLVDRHFFFDYFAHDVTGASGTRTVVQRVHGWLLRRLPRPQVVILLDAPAEVVYGRKPEGRLEELVSRRREYLALAERFPAIRTVNAARSIDQVEADVRHIIDAALTPQ